MLQHSRDDEELARLAGSSGHLLLTQYTAFLDERTPLELQALLPKLEQLLPVEARQFAVSVPLFALLRSEHAQSFRHTAISADVDFYSDARIPAREKSLLVAFAGSSGMLMMPSGLFLQHLPASRFDVACLADWQNASFEGGIRGFSGPLPAMVRAIALALGAAKYRRIYCYGTSMGGFPALKAGRLLGAVRAISMGGSIPWPINRLLAYSHEPIPSFDLLCSCASPSSTQLVAAFSSAFARDMLNAQTIRKRMPVRIVTLDRCRQHNVAFELVRIGQFDQFLSRMLDFDKAELHRPLLRAEGRDRSRAL
jgi:hypothetical protein